MLDVFMLKALKWFLYWFNHLSTETDNLINLWYLLLSLCVDNPISERALGYLACFQKLQGIDLSETHIKVKKNCCHLAFTWTFLKALLFIKYYSQPGMSLNKLVWSKMRLVPSDTPIKMFHHSCCKTEGWAQEVKLTTYYSCMSCTFIDL